MAEFGPSSDPDLDAAVAVRFDQLREMPPPDTWTAVDAARRRRWLLPAVAAAVAVAGIAALALATARGGDESIDDPEPPSTTLPVAVGRYASSTIDPTPVVRTPIDPNPSFLFLPTGGVERVDCGADDQLFVYTAADPPVALGSIGSGVSGSADFVPVGPGGELEVSGCGNAPSSDPSDHLSPGPDDLPDGSYLACVAAPDPEAPANCAVLDLRSTGRPPVGDLSQYTVGIEPTPVVRTPSRPEPMFSFAPVGDPPSIWCGDTPGALLVYESTTRALLGSIPPPVATLRFVPAGEDGLAISGCDGPALSNETQHRAPTTDELPDGTYVVCAGQLDVDVGQDSCGVLVLTTGADGVTTEVLTGDALAGGFAGSTPPDDACEADWDASLLLVDPTAGSVVWERPTPWFRWGEVEVVGHRVVGASFGRSGGGGGFVVDLSTGDPVWQRDAPDLPDPTPEYHDTRSVVDDVLLDQVWIGDGSRQELVAVDATTGEERWRHPGEPLYFSSAAPIGPTEARTSGEQRGQPTGFAPGLVFTTGFPLSTEVIALDARTGEPVWTYDATAEPYLVFADDALVVLTWPKTIERLDAATGAVLWSTVLEQDLTSIRSVAGHGGRLFAALDLPNAEEPFIEGPDPDGWVDLDLATGQVVQSGEMWADGHITLIDGDRLLTGSWDGARARDSNSDGLLVQITDLDNGAVTSELVVERPGGFGSYGLHALGDGFAVGQEIDGQRFVLTVYGADGSERWSWTGEPEQYPVPRLVGDLVVLSISSYTLPPDAPARGGLIALDAATGEQRWQLSTELAVERPVVATDLGILAVTASEVRFCE